MQRSAAGLAHVIVPVIMRGALRHVVVLALFAVALLVAIGARAAANEPASVLPSECPAGNLLATAQPLQGNVPHARMALLTDGVVAPEGAPWPTDDLVVVVSREAAFDLRRVVPISQIYVQIDADQPFAVDASTDGVTWTRVRANAHPTASGLVSRGFELGSIPARYLKLVATEPPFVLAVTEWRVHCQREPHVHQALRVVGLTREAQTFGWLPGVVHALTGSPVISPTGDRVAKLGVVLLALLLVGLQWRRGASGRGGADAGSPREARSKGREGWAFGVAWIGLAAVSVAAYYNFGAYRFEFVHDHDVFHYFVGAKYFPEIGYGLEYTCSAVAEVEAGFPQRVGLREQRDLRTNVFVNGLVAAGHRDECHARFSAERWEAFRRDVAYFANGRTVEDWHRILKDHGFNASPTWISLGRAVAQLVPASERTIGHRSAMFAGVVGPLDPLLLLAALAAVVWAFGLQAACAVALVFGCNPLSDFAWVGGGFLREAWLATLVVGICLLKKERWALGGATLALSALLQLFPVACLASVALAAVLAARSGAAREGAPDAPRRLVTSLGRWLRVERSARRTLVGAALALALLVPLSAWGSGRGGRAWPEFVANTEKHAATPSGNLVGLGTALSFRTATTVNALFDETADDPFARVRATRLAAQRRMRPVQGLVLLVGVALLGRALRRQTPLWLAAALGLALVPLALETSCYYAAWLAAFALVAEERRTLLLPIFGMVAAALAIKLSHAALDVDSALVSWVLVVGGLGVLALVGARGGGRAALPEDAPRG